MNASSNLYSNLSVARVNGAVAEGYWVIFAKHTS